MRLRSCRSQLLLLVTGAPPKTRAIYAYRYDDAGNLTAASMDGSSATYTVNAYGQRIAVARGTEAVRYALDIGGKLVTVRVTDGAETLSTVSYDYQGSPLLKAVSGWVDAIAWNQAAQPTSERYANGVALALSYDAVGRVQELSYTGSSGDLPNYAFTYDKAGNMTEKNGGRYAYDALNRLVTSAEVGPFLTQKTLQAWRSEADYGGTKTLELCEEETEVSLDAGSVSIGARFGSELEIRAIQLNPKALGHRVKIENLEVYVDQGLGYTKLTGPVLSIDSSGKIIASFDPALKAYGVKIHCLWDERLFDYSAGDEATFGNDSDAILSVTYLERNRKSSYAYDAAGNRTIQTIADSVSSPLSKDYAYWTGSDRLKTDGQWAYTYDANGNLIEKGTSYTVESDGSISLSVSKGVYWSYEYDLWNRMTAVKKGTSGSASALVVASYSYDPESLRIRKTTSAATYRYWYGVDGNVVAEKRVKGGQTRVRTYTYALGALVGYDEKIGSSTTRYWTCVDQIGSVTAETDSNGILVGRREYADFGAVGLDEAGEHEALSWYANREYDEDAELVYMNYRWYDPETGRFTTEDPIGSGVNWYGYCSNNPLTRVDPSGLTDTGMVVDGDEEFSNEIAKVKAKQRAENDIEKEKEKGETPIETYDRQQKERKNGRGGHFKTVQKREYSKGSSSRWVTDVIWVADPKPTTQTIVAVAEGGTTSTSIGSSSGTGRGNIESGDGSDAYSDIDMIQNKVTATSSSTSSTGLLSTSIEVIGKVATVFGAAADISSIAGKNMVQEALAIKTALSPSYYLHGGQSLIGPLLAAAGKTGQKGESLITFGGGPLWILGLGLALAPSIDKSIQAEDVRPILRAGGIVAFSTAGSVLGSAAGLALASGATASTLGTGSVLIPAATIGGGFLGGWAGEKMGIAVFGLAGWGQF